MKLEISASFNRYSETMNKLAKVHGQNSPWSQRKKKFDLQDHEKNLQWYHCDWNSKIDYVMTLLCTLATQKTHFHELPNISYIRNSPECRKYTTKAIFEVDCYGTYLHIYSNGQIICSTANIEDGGGQKRNEQFSEFVGSITSPFCCCCVC